MIYGCTTVRDSKNNAEILFKLNREIKTVGPAIIEYEH